MLQKNGFAIHFIDQQVDKSDIVKVTEELKPFLILIGGTSHTRFETFRISQQIKQVFPPATIVYGGPHASFTAENTLTYNQAIDIIAHGEGEYISLDLARWKATGGHWQSLKKIKGISYREDNQVLTTGWRPYIRDLDALPNPARDALHLNKYRMELEYLKIPATSIITARGCPIACSYCSASRMFQNHYAYRSPKLVVDEIEELFQTYNFKGLKIFDSTLNRNHVLKFCDELTKRNLVFPWECEVRVGSVTRELLEKMKKAGCYYIDVGFESGDQTILNQMHKQISLENAEILLEWAKELDIWVKGFFSLGHLGETYKTGKKTLAFMHKHKSRIKLIGYSPGIRIYPGTKVANYAQEKDLLPQGFHWSKPYQNNVNKDLFLPIDNIPILLQPQMGIRELKRLRIRYNLMRMLSIKHIIFKLKHLLHYGQTKKYLSMALQSVFHKGKNK